MRRISAYANKILFVGNLIWTIVLIFSWTFLPDNEMNGRNIDIAPVKEISLETAKRLLRGRYPNDQDILSRYLDHDLPIIYGVTPTYSRWTQKADLTRLCQTFLHIPNFYWIIVEDADAKTRLVANLLKNCGLPYTHLTAKTEKRVKLKEMDPNWLMPRGVAQRNEGLRWIRENINSNKPSVLYFIDDDNTYSLRLFEEMRFTDTVTVWPVGIVGGLKFEGPICKNGKVVKWYTAWKPDRPFPIDMAAFAVNMKLILNNQNAVFSNDVQRGYQESYFLTKLVTKDQLQARANDCTEILVWHTRTEKPNMKQESKLEKLGKASDPHMEV